MLWNLDVRPFNILRRPDQFLVLSVLNLDRDVTHFQKGDLLRFPFFLMRPHQYKVSEVLILISPHIAGRYRFQVLQTDVLCFHISTIPSISINMKSFPSIWGLDTDVCIHLVLSTHKYCSCFAILCQPPHSEKCFISDNICSQNSPKKQSYSISSRIFYMCLSQKPSPSNFMLYQSQHLYTSQPKTEFQDSHLNSVLL